MSSTAPHVWPPPPPIREENRGFGVYVHFPWCLAKCPYCDFLSLPLRSHDDSSSRPDPTATRDSLPHARYADSILRELDLRDVDFERGPLTSIFVGGGTPSLWHPNSLGRVIQHIVDRFGVEASAIEVTAEANPSSLDPTHLDALAEAKINRLSIGVQSFNPERLKFLGRLHDGEQARRAIRWAKTSKVARVSADLIYGIAGQTPEDALSEVQELVELGLTHISAYTLTIEDNTRFGDLARRGKLPLLDEGRVAESYTTVSEELERLGFEHYEISNFARPGQESQHNLGYWEGRDYLGLGVGAVGTITTRSDASRVRYKNLKGVERYMNVLSDATSSGPHQVSAETEVIRGETALIESLMLGLRTSRGVDLEAERVRRGINPWTVARGRAIEKLAAQGQLEVQGSTLRIPKKHWIIADSVIRELI